jgi:YgiT-type zinc finger domain-containing protein
MSAASSARCTACNKGDLTPTQLTVTLTYDGQSCSVDDNDALVCTACGEEFIGVRGGHVAAPPARPRPTCGDDRHGEPHDGDRVRHSVGRKR